MSKITSQQFQLEFRGGIHNDAATQARLDKAGIDGKKLLDSVDKDGDGIIKGKELEELFKKLDALDNDASAGSLSGKTPQAIVAALRDPTVKPMEMTGGSPPGTIKRGTKSPEVLKAQEKLSGLGYYLGPKGADSELGGSTAAAIKEFQKANGLEPTGELDPITLEKLNQAKPVYPEYDKMFADGVLQTTLGVGYDEESNDIWLRREIVEGLEERGFKKLDLSKASDEDLKKLRLDRKDLDPNATYYVKTFNHNGKEVTALVRLVDRNSPDAKDQFAKGMKKDDLVLYTGHGRMGSGPDFDADKSDKGNFVIGVPAEQGHYKLGKNDLDKKGALSDGYQLMLFDACNTKWYLDDLRGRAGGKGDEKLDVFASERELPWTTSKDDVLGTLDGVMGGDSMPALKARLDKNNKASGTGPAFRADGFKDNKYQPAAN